MVAWRFGSGRVLWALLAAAVQVGCGGEADPGSNTGTLSLAETTSEADINVQMVNLSTPTPVAGMTSSSFMITVTNNGPDSAQVRVQHALHADLQLPTWTCTVSAGGVCTATSGTANIDTMVTLPAGGTAWFVVQGTWSPWAQGIGELVASANPVDASDPITANNESSVVVTFVRQDDMRVTISDGYLNLTAGDMTRYWIVVENLGPSSGWATVVDNLPAALLSPTWTCLATGEGSECSPQSGTTSINALVTLPPGGSARFELDATIDPNFSGMLTNSATVATDLGDWDLTNNQSTDVTNVLPLDPPDPELDCSGITATAKVFPPNHRLVPLTLENTGDLSVTITDVKQDEPVNSTEDGDSAPDARLVSGAASLRAERSGTGDGRVYHVLFTAEDESGATCTGDATVCVPVTRGATCVDQGALYSSL